MDAVRTDDFNHARRLGIAAREAAADYWANPYLFSTSDPNRWMPLACTWWHGWLEADDFRSPSVWQAVRPETTSRSEHAWLSQSRTSWLDRVIVWRR